jgi:hypothetical protein
MKHDDDDSPRFSAGSIGSLGIYTRKFPPFNFKMSFFSNLDFTFSFNMYMLPFNCLRVFVISWSFFLSCEVAHIAMLHAVCC